MQEFYHKWHSQYLSRDFEMLVFGHSGIPLILFPTSNGRYYENKDNGLINSVEWLLNEGKIKIYCPDGFDWESWYNYDIHPADRIKTHIAYEKLIINDVIQFARFETNSQKVAVAGCSFGGYHAANLAFKYPDKIHSLFCLGGSFDIKPFILGHYDDDCYYNNPPDYLPGLDDKWYLNNISKMNIVLGTGENDICLDENRYLSGILAQKNINHWLDVKSNGVHDWQDWNQMFPHYLGNCF